MIEPHSSRPHMPGYGVSESADGLLAWSWAQDRLVASRNYWLATAWPDGRPHVMPVWGVWTDLTLWFSTGLRSRKARSVDFQDPDVNATVRVTPRWAFGSADTDFTGSPTRWTF